MRREILGIMLEQHKRNLQRQIIKLEIHRLLQ